MHGAYFFFMSLNELSFAYLLNLTGFNFSEDYLIKLDIKSRWMIPGKNVPACHVVYLNEPYHHLGVMLTFGFVAAVAS